VEIWSHTFGAARATERGGTSPGGCARSACCGPLIVVGGAHGWAGTQIYEVSAFGGHGRNSGTYTGSTKRRATVEDGGHHGAERGGNICGRLWGCLAPLARRWRALTVAVHACDSGGGGLRLRWHAAATMRVLTSVGLSFRWRMSFASSVRRHGGLSPIAALLSGISWEPYGHAGGTAKGRRLPCIAS
jgi:hypothetical protein